MPGGVCVNGGFVVPWPCAVLKRLGVSATAQSRPAGPGLAGVRRAEEGYCQAGAGSPKP